jgi:hypothetical protein
MTETIRQTVRLTTNAAEEVREVAERLGMTKTAVINLAVIAGLDALRLSINPDWKEYFEKTYEKTHRNKSSK